ncbi:MAG: DUF924 family protein [Acidiferrobacterales bacterium]
MSAQQAYEDVLDYWLGSVEPVPAALKERMRLWFKADPGVDAEILSRFGALIDEASAGQLTAWERMPRGRLALILLLDQFRRNVYRDNKKAFALDSAALVLCHGGIELEMDRDLSIIERAFFYVPMQHAEDLAVQETSVEAFRILTNDSPDTIRPYVAEFLASARTHHDIITRFGRFPHRNAILDRQCTAAEAAYLLSEHIPFRK